MGKIITDTEKVALRWNGTMVAAGVCFGMYAESWWVGVGVVFILSNVTDAMRLGARVLADKVGTMTLSTKIRTDPVSGRHPPRPRGMH